MKPLQSAKKHLKAALKMEDLSEWVDPETTYADPYSDAPRDYRAELEEVANAVDAAITELGNKLDEGIVNTCQTLHDVTLPDDNYAERLRAAYKDVIEWAIRDDPAGTAEDRIWRRSPDLIMFSESDRSLQSTYTFNEALVENPPPALVNLAGTALLDLTELLRLFRSGDIARRRTTITRANKRMDRVFSAAWKQSTLSVHFELDGDQLRVELMEDGDNVTVFDERSSGLRMFVALVAFLKVHASDRPPILLIDEAENHLHIDAQADLVNMFVTQQHAVKVIYTTHSPACLPPDLGTGIRVVVPRADNFQISDVRNSFWQGAAGYSPLMLAMGAAAAAYTPARYVVLAEGATEMILLPTLIRAAVQASELPYQIAPGLSEVPKEFLPNLDLEAARVAYLVDSDNGGAQLAKALKEAGVPERLITELGASGIERIVSQESYREAMIALLSECNPNTFIPEVPSSEGHEPIVDGIASWAREEGLRTPSKVAVANWLIENDKAIPSSEGVNQLVELHERLLEAFKL